jgi:hypothetical protein
MLTGCYAMPPALLMPIFDAIYAVDAAMPIDAAAITLLLMIRRRYACRSSRRALFSPLLFRHFAPLLPAAADVAACHSLFIAAAIFASIFHAAFHFLRHFLSRRPPLSRLPPRRALLFCR